MEKSKGETTAEQRHEEEGPQYMFCILCTRELLLHSNDIKLFYSILFRLKGVNGTRHGE